MAGGKEKKNASEAKRAASPLFAESKPRMTQKQDEAILADLEARRAAAAREERHKQQMDELQRSLDAARAESEEARRLNAEMRRRIDEQTPSDDERMASPNSRLPSPTPSAEAAATKGCPMLSGYVGTYVSGHPPT
jgi:anti-sigma factor RsiW